LCKKLHKHVKKYSGITDVNIKIKTTINTKQIATMAIFAALYCILALTTPIKIPTGIGLLEISIAALIASIFGIIL
jgi:hypothetical protein